MRFEQPKTYSISLTGWGFWLGSLAVAALLTGLGLGWLMVGLVALLLFLLSLPLLVLLAFRWWARRWITTDRCPVCGSEAQALEGSHFFVPVVASPCLLPMDTSTGKRPLAPSTWSLGKKAAGSYPAEGFILAAL
jgi:predicted lipid-binding transport protein (Tim44 family)